MSDKLREALERIANHKPGVNSGDSLDLMLLRGIAREVLADPQPTAPAVNVPSVEELEKVYQEAWDNARIYRFEHRSDFAWGAVHEFLENYLAKPAEIDLSELQRYGFDGDYFMEVFNGDYFSREKLIKAIESQGYKVKIEKGGV